MKENIMGFVILHYQAINETIDCVNSIKRILHNQNYKIVIVDNCSPNKSGHKLKQMYGNDQNVYCLLNHKNLGFANGNNIGYQFAKNHLNCDFICCLNNDTLMTEKIQSTLVNTIPLWKSQMVLALGVSHSKEAMKAQNEVSNMTNELLKKNAETLKMATIETAKESERGIVDIETLKYTNEQLISTLDEVLKIQTEGKAKREEAQKELTKIEGELNAKLMEIRR